MKLLIYFLNVLFQGSDNQRAEMTLPIAPAHWKYHLIRAIATASASDPTANMISITHHLFSHYYTTLSLLLQY